MKGREKICIKCGITSKEKPIIDVLCIDCYDFKVKIPKEITIERCKRCGKYKIKGEWKELSIEEVKEYIINKIRGDFEFGELDLKNKRVVLYFYKGDVETSRAFNYNAEIRTGLCRQCSRISGNYFEAIIQLRGDPKYIEKEGRRIAKKISKDSFISKIEDKREGVDIYVGSSKLALQIIRELGYSYKLSRKLHGLKQGKRVYRLTIALRF